MVKIVSAGKATEHMEHVNILWFYGTLSDAVSADVYSSFLGPMSPITWSTSEGSDIIKFLFGAAQI